jgi:putative ABC transport system permease protein
MTNLLRDLGHSLRRLSKNPALTLVVLVTLALGIGANTAMFTIDYASMIAPIPYPNPDQLVVVWSKVQGNDNGISAGDYLDWKHQSSAFQALDALTFNAFNISTQDQPEFVEGVQSTAGLFAARGLKFLLGRDFLPEEEQPGKNHVVVLSNKLWKRLGSDPNILGKSMRLDNIPYTIVGVWGASNPEERGDIWLDTPLSFKPEQINHDFHWLLAVGRLKPGVTIQQAQADMDRVTALIAKAYPKSNQGWGASVEPLKNDFFPKETRLIFWLLLGAVGFVLLIACVNVANLLLANGMKNQKEVAVRIALGATRKVIFAQQLIEGLVLAAVGGLLGVAVGYAMLHAALALMPRGTLPNEADLSLNFPILLFTFLATTLAGLLFGSTPAWYASRVSPGEILKEGGRSGASKGRHLLRRILVVGEFALALALLAGAGLAIHSFWNLQRVDLGVRTDHVLTFGLQVPDARPKDPDRIVAYYRQILDTVAAVPGVSHATTMTGMPLAGSFGMPFTIAGQPAFPDPSQRPSATFRMVTPEYFQTFGIRLVKGREFTAQDGASAMKVAMVNEEFANKFLKGSDPLQQRVVVEQLIPGVEKLGPPVGWQIVGIFHNVRGFGFRSDFPEIVVPFWQSPWPQANIGVRTAGDPATMIKSLAAAIHSVDPDIALAHPRTLDQVKEEMLSSDSFTAILFASFAGIALLLAAVGIYGVMAFSVAQRSHEIAIRMALGASQNRVISLIVREGLLLASIGLGLGLVGAYFVGRAMQSFLFGVHAMDYSAFAAVGLVLLLTALLACFLPARRAASVEPMQALRTE